MSDDEPYRMYQESFYLETDAKKRPRVGRACVGCKKDHIGVFVAKTFIRINLLNFFAISVRTEAPVQQVCTKRYELHGCETEKKGKKTKKRRRELRSSQTPKNPDIHKCVCMCSSVREHILILTPADDDDYDSSATKTLPYESSTSPTSSPSDSSKGHQTRTKPRKRTPRQRNKKVDVHHQQSDNRLAAALEGLTEQLRQTRSSIDRIRDERRILLEELHKVQQEAHQRRTRAYPRHNYLTNIRQQHNYQQQQQSSDPPQQQLARRLRYFFSFEAGIIKPSTFIINDPQKPFCLLHISPAASNCVVIAANQPLLKLLELSEVRLL